MIDGVTSKSPLVDVRLLSGSILVQQICMFSDSYIVKYIVIVLYFDFSILTSDYSL